ncbi:MAG: hypothetical protein HWN81_21020 [Candidatus Lokiarchaeota archaeon]|nr:hypothetical protein [Candidatus Lokiarchaeota archaeon]
MINEGFKKNWLKILKFNENREILEDPEKIKEYIRIPLSPITINANILYNFFELFYPKFINDQQNILDIVISEAEKKNKVLGLYLYKTEKAGVHQTIESLPEGLIRFKSWEIERLDDIFNKIQNEILKEKGIRISSIRLFKKEAIELINKHCERIEEISIYDFLERFLELIQKLFEQDLLLIYPEPIVFEFLKRGIELLGNIQMKNCVKFLEEILPEFNTSLVIIGNKIKIVILLQKIVLKSGKSELRLKIFTPDELEIKINDLNITDNLLTIQNKLKTMDAYYLNQNDIISFISEFFELAIPIKKENLKFLLQKVLFGYRSFEKHWNMIPRPKIYNTLRRFLIRLFGFNINLRKLSHWAIPDLIFNYLDFYFGLNSRILFIITDLKDNKKLKISRERLSKNACKHIFLLEFEESTLTKLRAINKEELFSSAYDSIYSIKGKLTEKYGALSAVIIVDKFLLENIIKNFIFDHMKFSFFPRFKTLKLMRNERYLTIFPEFPFYKLIKKKKSLSIMKLLLPILIDKHEF